MFLTVLPLEWWKLKKKLTYDEFCYRLQELSVSSNFKVNQSYVRTFWEDVVQLMRRKNVNERYKDIVRNFNNKNHKKIVYGLTQEKNLLTGIRAWKAQKLQTIKKYTIELVINFNHLRKEISSDRCTTEKVKKLTNKGVTMIGYLRDMIWRNIPIKMGGKILIIKTI